MSQHPGARPLTPAAAFQPGARGDPDRRRAFEIAARHSRRVRRLRIALPLFGVLLALGVAGVGVVTRIGLSIGAVALTGEGLSMDAPRLSGSDGKGRTYEVTAARAIQDLSNTQLIRLTDIVATIHQANGDRADLTASAGLYDGAASTLTLTERIVIRASDGSTADLTRAVIDLATGDVVSDAPVAFSSSLGAVEAKRMQVDEKAGAVTFRGGVRMTVTPDAVSTPPRADAQETSRP